MTIDNGRKVVVANSNDSFRNPSGGPVRPGPDSLTIIDTEKIREGAAAVVGTIATDAMPIFFRSQPTGAR
jgi:hypothetical protein